MHVHIGLAFCVENIYYAGFLKNNQTLMLDQVGSVPYPFYYKESDFIGEEKIPQLAQQIKSRIQINPSDNYDISISIESNLAVVKRIAFPDNFNQKEEREHIAWELSQSIIEPVDQYVFFKTVNHFDFEHYRDYLTIAMRKKVVHFFNVLSKQLGMNLVDLSINQLVPEFVLRNILDNNREGLIGLFKIGRTRLETTLLWNGSYYNSHYDRIKNSTKTAGISENYLTKIKDKIKQMEKLFEQLTNSQITVSKIFLYGENVEDSVIQMLQKNVSVVAFRLNPLQNIDKSEKLQNALPSVKEATRYVESIGIVLDQ